MRLGSVLWVSAIRINGVSLYYEVHGAGSPILCIHGGGSSALLWGEAVPELARFGRVIVYDRRGCTRSERPDPYQATVVGEHADDAAALLEALAATPAVVIGRSYGGEIALDLLRRYPDLVRALVLLEPAILTLSAQSRAGLETLTVQARAIAAADGPGPAAEHLYRAFLGDPTWVGLPEGIRRVLLDNGPAILAELNGERFTPTAAAYTRVTQPVLIVSGDTSPPAYRVVDDALARMIPGARHEVIGGGHLVNPAAPVVLEFLQPILASGRPR
jgi:pimeloyl-ACP methyl ester carboxylesterase